MEIQNSNIVKRHYTDSEEKKFIDGRIRSSVLLQSCAVGLGTYNPGWKWSIHAGKQTDRQIGKPSDNHIGYIVSGNMMIKDISGIETEVGPGEAFEVGPDHDAWVIGNKPCVALDFIPIVN